MKQLKPSTKKIIILSVMVILLVVVATLNFVLNANLSNNDKVEPGDGQNAVTTFFSSHRANRQNAREQEFAYLDSIIASATSSDAAKAAAEQEKLDLCKIVEKELVVEGLIKAKGFEDAVVTMSTNNVNVIVKDNELTSAKVAQILSVITQETGYKPANVVVVPYQLSNT